MKSVKYKGVNLFGCSYIIYKYFLVHVTGFVQLDSSIGILSGNLGPRNVTFTCDATSFTSGTIHWFIDNYNISSYAFTMGDVYPLIIPTNPPITGITVQLGDVMITLGLFSFKNFTLMTTLCNLLQFEGKNLSCGLMEQRSEFISIDFGKVKNLGTIFVLLAYM